MATASIEIKKKEILSSIAKNYNSLQYTPQLVEWLGSIYPKQNFLNASKFQLHKKLNEALINSHTGELSYKYSLFKKFQHQKLIGGFEMKVNKSRVDFLTINGVTTCFEIKSTIDNLTKLSKQADDYLSVFEYNNVVIDEKHLVNCQSKLPDSFGIIVFKKQRQKVIRRPLLNTNIQPEIQLGLLTKRELMNHFQQDQPQGIVKYFEPKVINTNFKKALKARYSSRWNFIVNNSTKILPIDLQFFFNTQISPKAIYS